jgi:sec-independent protein translocase protein TatB
MDRLPLALLLDSVGASEWFVLLVVVLIAFGPKRLPGAIRSIGRALSQLRRASDEFRDQVMSLDQPGEAESVFPPVDAGPAPSPGAEHAPSPDPDTSSEQSAVNSEQ